MSFKLLLIIILYYGHQQAKAAKNNTAALTIPKGYNMNNPPEGNLTIWVSHVVRDIADVNDKDFSITFILETMMGWNDDRIQINPNLFKDAPETERF